MFASPTTGPLPRSSGTRSGCRPPDPRRRTGSGSRRETHDGLGAITARTESRPARATGGSRVVGPVESAKPRRGVVSSGEERGGVRGARAFCDGRGGAVAAVGGGVDGGARDRDGQRAAGV